MPPIPRSKKPAPTKSAARTKPDASAASFRPFAKLGKTAKPKKPASGPPSRPVAAPPPPPQASEGESFEALVRGVVPIDKRKARTRNPDLPPLPLHGASQGGEPPKTDRSGAKKKPAIPVEDDPGHELRTLVFEGVRFEVSDDGSRVEGRRVDIDPREVRRLRHRRYSVDGKLDLHGKSALEARSAIAKFLKLRRIAGDRAVVIVHGKGNHSPGGYAVLRGEIGAWLSQGEAATHICAFASLIDQDGESGSVFVLLDRR